MIRRPTSYIAKNNVRTSNKEDCLDLCNTMALRDTPDLEEIEAVVAIISARLTYNKLSTQPECA